MLWIFIELNKDGNSRIKDIEQLIFNLMTQFRQEAASANVPINTVETEYLFPFLESLMSKNRSSEFGLKMEKLCVATQLNIRLDYNRIVEGQSTVFTNPKPQTMDVWVKQQVKNG